MPFSQPPLRIAVVGPGKIGSAFAFQLAREGGHDVTVVARPGSLRLAQLERDGGIIDHRGQRAEVRVCSALQEETPYNAIIVTLLAHQIAAVLPALQRSAAKKVQFMFNTVQPERLEAAVGLDRCVLGMPFIQATLSSVGRLKATIGSGGQRSLLGDQGAVEVFNAAGLPAALEPDMALWLRCHAPLCIAFESIAVAGVTAGGGAPWARAVTLAQGVRACYTLLKSLGLEVYPKTKRRIAGAPIWATAAMLWVMSRVPPFRELLATGKEEAQALTDALIAAAPQDAPRKLLSDILKMKPT